MSIVVMGLLFAYQRGVFTSSPRADVRVESLHVDNLAVGKAPFAKIVVESTALTTKHCVVWFRPGPSAMYAGAPHEDAIRTAEFVIGPKRTTPIYAQTRFPVAGSARTSVQTSAWVRCGTTTSPTMTATSPISR